jgi:NAD(P)-dependent dehydrogenase (short-subunit alcohol dehydrogenase family)
MLENPYHHGSSPMLLKDKVALVTGAASGIGRAIAVAYARESAQIVLSDLDDDGCRATARMLTDAYPGIGVEVSGGDVTDAEYHTALVELAERRFGRLDVACNNAGIAGNGQPVSALDPSDWQRVIDVNLTAVFLGMRAQIPALRRAGGGAIVNMGSIMSTVSIAGAAPYVAAKHGVLGLTRATALECAVDGIRINTVGPAFIDTPLLGGIPPEARAFLITQHPIGRLGRADEVAELVLWLSSDRASFATGAYYPIDGGYLAR